MSSEIYRFTVGAFECAAVSDGTYNYAPPTFPPPATFLFPNAPQRQLKLALREHNLEPEQWTGWISPYICLTVDTGKHRVLVDTGADGLDPNTGRLLHNLRTARITPEEIDTVVLTHGHPDHIGGNTDAQGGLVFRNARYVMWKDEWDFWTTEQAAQKLDEHGREVLLGFAHKNLPPLRRQLDLIDRETEIVPGIRAVAAPGHTPGHMALAIASGSELLLCLSDAVLHPIHLEQPEWYAVVDFAPDQVVSTRRRLLHWAAAENALVLAFHFPFPGLGRVAAKGGAWQWQPIATFE
jgi:glyoxylase-like metal-dependent hydrolase (beta-lactamase superfamily II)